MRVFLLLGLVTFSQSYPDYYSYGDSDFKQDTFGPADWDLIRCRDVDHCPGWPTNWKEHGQFIPYNPDSNTCKECSHSDHGVCLKHNQSPIALERKVTAARVCDDRHRMRYWKGECRFNSLEFQVLPHVLRAYQPETGCDGTFQPQIDFSRGFPDPWVLSHTDIAVPSHHTLEGKRYDAEVMMTHTYATDHRDKLTGVVSVLLEIGEPSDRYDFLDLYLERWTKEANKVHRHCFGEDAARKLEAELKAVNKDLEGDFEDKEGRHLEEEDYELHDPQHQDDTSVPRSVSKEYYNRDWHPYDWYSKTNTEYYFRYQGSLTEPPCLEHAHWRVLKDAVVVAPSQIRTVHALIKSRLDPDTCEYSTAAKVRTNRKALKVETNRPLQTTTVRHKLVYCECDDWPSKSDKDKVHCTKSNKERGIEKFAGVSSTPSSPPVDAVLTTSPMSSVPVATPAASVLEPSVHVAHSALPSSN